MNEEAGRALVSTLNQSSTPVKWHSTHNKQTSFYASMARRTKISTLNFLVHLFSTDIWSTLCFARQQPLSRPCEGISFSTGRLFQGLSRYTTTHWNTHEHSRTHYDTLQHTSTHCSIKGSLSLSLQGISLRGFHMTLQHTGKYCNTLQHISTHTLQHSGISLSLLTGHPSGVFARHCNTLQHTATCCNTLQHTATHCNIKGSLSLSTEGISLRGIHIMLQHTATRCNTLQHAATHCNTLQHRGIFLSLSRASLSGESTLHCNTLQYTATHCNTLQHTATHCNTLQHTPPSALFWASKALCNTSQHAATHCNTLCSQINWLHEITNSATHTATHRNTLQHAATHYTQLRGTLKSACS